jgi:hypothetical protein
VRMEQAGNDEDSGPSRASSILRPLGLEADNEAATHYLPASRLTQLTDRSHISPQRS